MNFAIEVPAEANPLNTQTLYNVLQSASSSDQQQVKTGAQQLQNWEKFPGFYSSLQTLYVDYSLPVELRYLAIIQLKNGIDKYWRKTATNAIKKDEKDLIRSRCLESGIKEPDKRLALQTSVLIAKIIRTDYPQDWPDVIDAILQRLRSEARSSGTTLKLSNALLVLLYAVKELSAARLQRSRAKLQSATPVMIDTISTIYTAKVSLWMSAWKNGSGDDPGLWGYINQSLLALRILRRLIVAGYDFPNRDQDICNVWMTFTSQFAEMLAVVQGASTHVPTRLQYFVGKHLVQISKLHLETAKSHPAGYAMLPYSAELARAYWGLIRQFGENYGSQTVNSSQKVGTDGDTDDELTVTPLEKVSLKGLLLIRACVKMVFNPIQTIRLQQPEDKEEKKRSNELMRNELLTENFASEVMETLVTKFFVFTPRDLKQWEEEPDEWEKSQEGGGEDWDFSIRTCSEKLFLDLMINYKDVLVQPLLAVFRNVADVRNTNVMLKDSIYAAIGLAAPVLERYPEFEFGDFLDNVLSQEVQIQQPGYNLLRRRAAIVLGQWLPVKEGLNRPLVYQIFQHLLDRSDQTNDQVVRVTAARQLKSVIDPFEFTPEQFIPFAPSILGNLMSLVQEVELPETKLALLNTIRVLVTRMERSIVSFADQIISLLPPLWDQAEDEYLMKQTILGILSSLCTAMEAESRRYHSVIIPLVRSSVDPNSETRLYLIDDALDLWTSVLTQTPSEEVLPETITLVQYLFPLFEVASENLRKALEITELYVYLIPSEMLSNALTFLKSWLPLLDSSGIKKHESVGMVTSLVELLIRSANSSGGLPAVSELTKSLVSSNWLSIICSGIQDLHRFNQSSGPNRALPKINSLIETNYFQILSQIAIVSPSLFISALEATIYDSQANPNETVTEKLDWLLTEWFDHAENISHPTHKKSNCMALTSLLELAQPWMLSRLQLLMNEWVSTVTELIVDVSLEEDKIDNQDCLVYKDPNSLKSEGFEAPHDMRRRMLTLNDPVHRVDIREVIRGKLAIAVEACGGMEVFQREWVQNVDADVLKAFGELGIV